MKSIFESKVFWLAVAQAVVGVLVVFTSAFPEVGGLVIAKSVADIVLRLITVEPAKL
jgi:uncharacterized membrane protein